MEELDVTNQNTNVAEETAGQPVQTPPAAQDDKVVLKVEHLKKYFPIQTSFFGKPLRFLRAVDDITFDVERGKTIGVVGESGCGKTTLGRTILKLYESDGGRIVFQGDDITGLKRNEMIKYRTDIQLIFQDPYSSLPPRMTIGSIIAEAVRVHKIVPKEEVHSYVLDVMKKCGLKPQHYDRYPHEFSGGQRQRICIARALAVKPKLVICDEPVSALDVSIQAQIINLLKELQKKDDLTYVFISHDLSVVKYITDNILVMYLGNAMEFSETEELFDNPLHPYTKALFSAVPAPDPSVKMNRIVLEGDIPSPANPPDGCKFHTRCSKCMNVCKYKTPEYVEAKPGHFVACHLYNDAIMSDLDKYEAEFVTYTADKRAAREAAAQKAIKGRHWFTWKKKLEEWRCKQAELYAQEDADSAALAEKTRADIAREAEEKAAAERAAAEKAAAEKAAAEKAAAEQAAAEKAEADKAKKPAKKPAAKKAPAKKPAEKKPAAAKKPAAKTAAKTTAKVVPSDKESAK